MIQSGIGVIHVVRSAQRNTQTVKKSVYKTIRGLFIGAAEVGAREKKKDKSFKINIWKVTSLFSNSEEDP